MATRGRLEVTLTRENGQTLVLRLGTNQACELEEKLGKPFGLILRELSPEIMNLRTLRALLQVGITPALDPVAVGDLMDEIGVDSISDAIGQVVAKRISDAEQPEQPTGVM